MSLAKLLHECPTALAVFLHLLELASRSGKLRLTTTRKAIARYLDVKKADTITTALKALAAEKALSYHAHAKTNARGQMRGWYYLISLHRTHCNGVLDNHFYERRTRCNGASVEKPSLRRTRCRGVTVSKETTAGGFAVAPPPPAEAEPPPTSQEIIDRALG